MSELRDLADHLHVKGRTERGVLVLAIATEDLEAPGVTDALLRELTDAGDESGASQVVLDLRRVRVLGSAGVAALLAFRRHIRQKGGFMLLCDVQPPVAEVLFAARTAGDTSSMKIPFGVAPDMASAVAYLTGAGWGSYQVHPVEERPGP